MVEQLKPHQVLNLLLERGEEIERLQHNWGQTSYATWPGWLYPSFADGHIIHLVDNALFVVFCPDTEDAWIVPACNDLDKIRAALLLARRVFGFALSYIPLNTGLALPNFEIEPSWLEYGFPTKTVTDMTGALTTERKWVQNANAQVEWEHPRSTFKFQRELRTYLREWKPRSGEIHNGGWYEVLLGMPRDPWSMQDVIARCKNSGQIVGWGLGARIGPNDWSQLIQISRIDQVRGIALAVFQHTAELFSNYAWGWDGMICDDDGHPDEGLRVYKVQYCDPGHSRVFGSWYKDGSRPTGYPPSLRG